MPLHPLTKEMMGRLVGGTISTKQPKDLKCAISATASMLMSQEV